MVCRKTRATRACATRPETPAAAKRRRRSCASIATVVVLCVAACSPPVVRSTATQPVTAEQLAQLWVERDLSRRDLLHDPGGRKLMPDPNGRFEYVSEDTTGTSRGWDVKDENGLVWDVKIGAEAQPEVVVSRLLWAAGFHQLPTYYVTGWSLTRKGKTEPQPPGRFRPKLPEVKKVGEWSWHANPFVDTQPYRGLIVLNLMVNNWDFKTSNNAVYDVVKSENGAHRWYAVKDIGASLGQTPRWIRDGTPNDVELFEKQGFIKGVENGQVQFDYIRPHNELFAAVTPADVRWAGERLNRLTAEQWANAFRAGGYDDATATRYITKLKAKIAEGANLPQ